jgi:hypothetical protein
MTESSLAISQLENSALVPSFFTLPNSGTCPSCGPGSSGAPSGTSAANDIKEAGDWAQQVAILGILKGKAEPLEVCTLEQVQGHIRSASSRLNADGKVLNKEAAERLARGEAEKGNTFSSSKWSQLVQVGKNLSPSGRVAIYACGPSVVFIILVLERGFPLPLEYQ